jgi:hypothetical protein
MGVIASYTNIAYLNDVGFSSHAVRVIFFLGKITRRYNKNPSPTLPFEKKGSSPPFKKGGVRGGFPKKSGSLSKPVDKNHFFETK